jgi:hypothetical protein
MRKAIKLMLNFGGNIYRERKKPVGRLRCELDSAG